mgnify:CR=1 FL=1
MLNMETVARYEQLEREGKLTRGQQGLLAAHRRGVKKRGTHSDRREEIKALGWAGLLAKYPNAMEAARGEGIPHPTLFSWLGPQPPELKAPRVPVAQRSLTRGQRRVLHAIADLRSRLGQPPTLREIGAELGITSTNGVADHLKALVAKGYVERPEGKSSRGIVLTREYARVAEREAADGDEVGLALAKLAQARSAIDAAEKALRRAAQTLAGKRTVDAM